MQWCYDTWATCQLKLKENTWALHSCDKTLFFADMAENHVLKLEMRARNSQPGTYGCRLQRGAWFCLWKPGYLNISPLRQEHKPFDVVPASSGQLQPGKCMWWAVYSSPSQITPQWVSPTFPFSNGNSSGWVGSEFKVTLSALNMEWCTEAARGWSAWLLNSLERKDGRRLGDMKRNTRVEKRR